ncbi:MAG: DUF4336 domain-containing protein [Candidatus Thorarchaeota archaeon]|nr:DUF4336 domain-containing protein [Candidatus Thorarchaeota archaeon]
MSGLHSFGENIWIVEGPLVRDMRAWFTTRMTIVKLSSGSVWIESPVPASPDTMESIAEIGPVKYLVAATMRHVWRLDNARTQFPDAQLWVCRRTRLTLQHGELPITGILTDTPPPDWADDFEQLEFKGNRFSSEVLFYHKKSHTVIIGDLIASNKKIKGKPLSNFIFRLGGVLYPKGGVSRDIRMSFRDRDLARQSLETLLSWDFDRLIIAHGDCIETGAKSYVEEKFQWLNH